MRCPYFPARESVLTPRSRRDNNFTASTNSLDLLGILCVCQHDPGCAHIHQSSDYRRTNISYSNQAGRAISICRAHNVYHRLAIVLIMFPVNHDQVDPIDRHDLSRRRFWHSQKRTGQRLILFDFFSYRIHIITTQAGAGTSAVASTLPIAPVCSFRSMILI